MTLRIIHNTVLGGAVGVLMAGCVSTPRQTALPEMRPLGAEYTTVGRVDQALSSGKQGEPIELAVAMNLHQALGLALLRNPELSAFAYEVRAAEARALQARRLPNPEI